LGAPDAPWSVFLNIVPSTQEEFDRWDWADNPDSSD
jgi:hypothetical protein